MCIVVSDDLVARVQLRGREEETEDGRLWDGRHRSFHQGLRKCMGSVWVSFLMEDSR